MKQIILLFALIALGSCANVYWFEQAPSYALNGNLGGFFGYSIGIGYFTHNNPLLAPEFAVMSARDAKIEVFSTASTTPSHTFNLQTIGGYNVVGLGMALGPFSHTDYTEIIYSCGNEPYRDGYPENKIVHIGNREGSFVVNGSLPSETYISFYTYSNYDGTTGTARGTAASLKYARIKDEVWGELILGGYADWSAMMVDIPYNTEGTPLLKSARNYYHTKYNGWHYDNYGQSVGSGIFSNQAQAHEDLFVSCPKCMKHSASLDGVWWQGMVVGFKSSLSGGLDMSNYETFQGSPSSSVYMVAFGDHSNEFFGKEMVVVGDVNGDGLDDLFISAPHYTDTAVSSNAGDTGMVRIYYGDTKYAVGGAYYYDVKADTYITGCKGISNCLFGWSIKSLGDLNLDGYVDFLVSAPGFNDFRGKVFAISGSPDMLDNNINIVWEMEGAYRGHHFGWDMALADFNLDGYKDVLISGYGEWGNIGSVSIFHAVKNTNLTWTHVGEGAYSSSTGATFNFTLQNYGPIIQNETMVVIDYKRTEFTVNDFSYSGPGSCTLDALNHRVNCSLGDFEVGVPAYFNFDVYIEPNLCYACIIDWTATATGYHVDFDDAIDTLSVSVSASADVAVRMVQKNATLNAGDQQMYTAWLTNYGPATAFDAKIEIPYGSLLQYITHLNGAGTCSTGPSVFSCVVTEMPKGAEYKFDLFAKVNPSLVGAANATVTATTLSNDPYQGNNTDYEEMVISSVCDLAVTLTSSTEVKDAGDTITYYAALFSSGPSSCLGVDIDFQFENKSSIVNIYNEGYITMLNTSCTLTGTNKAHCTYGTVEQYGTSTVIVELKTDSDLQKTEVFGNCSVSTTSLESEFSNNEDNVTNAIRVSADLEVIIRLNYFAQLVPGVQIYYELLILNNGPSAVKTVNATFQYSEGQYLTNLNNDTCWEDGTLARTIHCYMNDTLLPGTAIAVEKVRFYFFVDEYYNITKDINAYAKVNSSSVVEKLPANNEQYIYAYLGEKNADLSVEYFKIYVYPGVTFDNVSHTLPNDTALFDFKSLNYTRYNTRIMYDGVPSELRISFWNYGPNVAYNVTLNVTFPDIFEVFSPCEVQSAHYNPLPKRLEFEDEDVFDQLGKFGEAASMSSSSSSLDSSSTGYYETGNWTNITCTFPAVSAGSITEMKVARLWVFHNTSIAKIPFYASIQAESLPDKVPANNARVTICSLIEKKEEVIYSSYSESQIIDTQTRSFTDYWMIIPFIIIILVVVIIIIIVAVIVLVSLVIVMRDKPKVMEMQHEMQDLEDDGSIDMSSGDEDDDMEY